MTQSDKLHITSISAMGSNRVIGVDGAGMPWGNVMRTDLRFFRKMTIGKPLIMGRKTHDAMEQPLKKRPCIILTTNTSYTPKFPTPQTEIAHTIPQAIEMAKSHLGETNEIMIIGGGMIYSAFMPWATRIYLTEIEEPFAGDILFPEVDPAVWQEVSRTAHPADEKNAYPYQFVTHERH